MKVQKHLKGEEYKSTSNLIFSTICNKFWEAFCKYLLRVRIADKDTNAFISEFHMSII